SDSIGSAMPAPYTSPVSSCKFQSLPRSVELLVAGARQRAGLWPTGRGGRPDRPEHPDRVPGLSPAGRPSARRGITAPQARSRIPTRACITCARGHACRACSVSHSLRRCIQCPCEQVFDRSSMEITDRQRRLLELCAIRVDRQSVDWSLIARQVQDAVGLDDLAHGIITEKSIAAERSRPILREGLRNIGPLTDRVAAELDAASGAGAQLVTVLDQDYPANLRLIPNLPPFLFYRGILSDDDARSVAVVGTRQASDTGLRRAAHISK